MPDRLFFTTPVFALIACWLQGCVNNDGEKKAPLEICPSFHFDGDGYVTQTPAGGVVQVSCPMDSVYSGPQLQCNWVDRYCVAYTQADIDPQFCMDQYNLTLYGRGLSHWPSGVHPKLVTPHGLLRTNSTHGIHKAQQGHGSDGRRLEETILPRIVTPEELKCGAEVFTDLDFQRAVVVQNNLFGQGPSRNGHKSLEFMGIAKVHGHSVNLELSATTNPRHEMLGGTPERNGKGSAAGRIHLNTSFSVDVTFRFRSHSTGAPAVLPKVFLTLFDITKAGVGPLEVNVSGMSEYYLPKHPRFSIQQMGSDLYSFKGGVGQEQQQLLLESHDDGDGGAATAAEEPAKHKVKELWLDSLNRSAVLVFRETSEFSLSVRAPRGARDLEFAGWSELVDPQLGQKVACRGAASVADAEAKFHSSLETTRPFESGLGVVSTASATLCAVAAALLGCAAAFVPCFFLRRQEPQQEAVPASYKAFSCQVERGGE